MKADKERMFWHRLAWEGLHCTVAEARNRVGRAEFLDWVAYISLMDEAAKNR
jgi:hypothetical protein